MTYRMDILLQRSAISKRKIKSWPARPRSGGDGGVALHLLVQSTTPLTKPLHHGEHLCQYHQTSMSHETELNSYTLHKLPIYFSYLKQILNHKSKCRYSKRHQTLQRIKSRVFVTLTRSGLMRRLSPIPPECWLRIPSLNVIYRTL